MKIKQILLMLTALTIASSTLQVNASGLTYDPTANYYNTFYGIDAEKITTVNTTPVAQNSTADIGPYNGYYATYYGTGVKNDSVTRKEVADNALIDNMANPLNYYNW